MDDATLDDLVALVPPLLQCLEALRFVARYLNPAEFADLLQAVGTPETALQAALPRLARWPTEMAGLRERLEASSAATLAAFAALRAIEERGGDVRAAYRALRHAPAAHEALYPLAAVLPPVSHFFTDPAMRDDSDLQKRLAAPRSRDDAGILHADNEPGSRGGFSLYVPEYYTPDQSWPLVVALHGGSGNGRSFLWTWLPEARSHGAILVSPTAVGSTWALMGEDADTPNLARIVDFVRGRWNVDDKRILMTGMSDGGTFCYVSGLVSGSPFTHLAPVAAAFHPMIAEMADPQRLGGLPIFLVHGVLDWMFPVDLARQAARALSAAGARVTFRELDDLSHTYPRDMNAPMLAWLREPT
jgi:phospholipase/carboxylesterase